MKRAWLESARPAISMVVLFTILTGAAYPILVWTAAHAVFAWEAEGSLLSDRGRVVGSARIGQPFTEPRYLWGRLSATGGFPYNAQASGGSNLGPLHPALVRAAEQRIAALRAADSTLTGAVPVDLVTASGSGLDPDISPAAAYVQVPRIARARGADPQAVRGLIERHVDRPGLGVIGEPHVNVLSVNLELDRVDPDRLARRILMRP
jgi:K+-transporting ATPase ATPase C chain